MVTTLNNEEAKELEYLRSRVKEMESLNKTYLKVIGDLSETVNNMSVTMIANSKNELNIKKV